MGALPAATRVHEAVEVEAFGQGAVTALVRDAVEMLLPHELVDPNRADC